MTSAQSCFLRKALSSRWASPRVVTSTEEKKAPALRCDPRQRDKQPVCMNHGNVFRHVI